jgi:hypothetical protein
MGRANDNDRYVQQRPDGKWELVKADHRRASAMGDTQAQMIDRCRQVVLNVGGGELAIKGRDGRIRDKDTIAPGNESPKRDNK